MNALASTYSAGAATEQENNHLLIAKTALNAQSEAVAQLGNRLGAEFNLAVNRILACRGRVVVCGMGKSGLVGKKLVATLASTGTPSFYLHPAEAFHGDLGMMTPEDLIILISYSGETEEVIKLIPSLKRFGNGIIAMAGNGKSTLARHADVWLDISVVREICPNNLAPTTSTLVTMAMGDAVAVALINARRFQPMDFAKFHPGGSLGRRLLTRVRDVMHTDLPTVSVETSFHDCLLTMTRGRMGLTLVTQDDVLLGIVTDGDIRRTMLKNPDVSELCVGEFMTCEPRVIGPNAQLEEASCHMQEHKVKALVVVENGTPCGILEIFD